MKILDELESESVIKVIYHGSECPDGFGSAWACWMYFSHLDSVSSNAVAVEYVAANHGEAPPECAGAIVFLVDFSYRREVLTSLLAEAKQVIILDHHISAQRDLEGLEDEHQNLEVVFDMTRSGAVITWQYFHDMAVPEILRYVQDRDLWQFALPDSQHVTAAMMSYPFEFSRWLQWHEGDANGSGIALLAREGKTINRFRQQMINYYKTRAVIGQIAGYEVPIVNSPLAINSELLNELADGYPFAAGYSDKGTKRGWSLRSRNGGADVSEIAFQFGGGGHPRAAGFATALDINLLCLKPVID